MHQQMLFGSLAGASGYTIEQSAWFDGNGDYLSATPTTTGNRRTLTFSAWVKRTGLAHTLTKILWGAGDASAGSYCLFGFSGSNLPSGKPDRLWFESQVGGGSSYGLYSTAEFSDVSGWIHVMLRLDTTQSTAGNRVRMYVNGVQQTLTDVWSGQPAQDTDYYWNLAGTTTHIGKYAERTDRWYDGYMAEACMYDGASLAPDSFGETNSDGIWVPIEPPDTGFGTNGFHLKFDDADNLGKNSVYASPSSYVPVSVNFDGTNDYLNRSGAITGLSDGSAFTLSFWVRKTGGDGGHMIVFTDNAGHFQSQIHTNNKINIKGHNSGAAELIDMNSSVEILADGRWRHVMFSTNTSSDTHHLYVDGVDAADKQNSSTGTMDLTQADYTVGGAYGTGFSVNWGVKMHGDIADLYFTDEYIDLSSASNRIKFIDANKLPVSLGSDGSTPTGTAARVYLNQNALASWHTNAGNGGGFTESGALTAGLAVRPAGVDLAVNGSMATTQKVLDSPTDDSDNNIGNYATWNPHKFMNDNLSAYSFTNGNLKVTGDSGNSGNNGLFSTVGLSGKHYAETKILGSSNISGGRSAFGILASTATNASNTTCLSHSSFSGISLGEAIVYASGSSGNNYTDVSVNDVIGIAVDVSAGKMWIRVNSDAWLTTGSAGNPATGANPTLTFTAGTDYYWACYCYNASDILETTFGQTAYTTSAPSGFGATYTASATAPAISKPSDYFDAILYTGTGSELAISSLAFQPDMVWIKNRDQSDSNMVYDVARGATKEWHTDTTDAETTTAQTLKSFDSDGFTLGTDVQVNTNTEKYVAWCWKAGGSASTISGGMTKTSDSSTTDTTRSVDTAAGFSIMTYTGNGSASTITHGLGAKPEFIIVRQRNASAVAKVWHVGLDSATRGYLVLNADDIQYAWGDDRMWGPDPVAGGTTSIGVGTHVYTNDSTDTYVAYAWTPIAGFSSFGKYRGNASADGPYVYLGFQPAFMIIKKMSGTTNDWNLIDDQRLIAGNDGDRVYLYANDKSGGHTEQNPGDSSQDLDILSNGFKVRNTGNGLNKSGDDYIYCAWANTPFASNNRGF